MLIKISLVLFAMWAFGYRALHLPPAVHVLLVAALALALIHLIQLAMLP